MDLEELYGGSFVDWERVGSSWAKRTPSSRLMLFAARRYLGECSARSRPARKEFLEPLELPAEIVQAFAAPPHPEDEAAGGWGRFMDTALAAELEMVSYGERPPILWELKAGFEAAASEAGECSALGRWFTGRREALPGGDLPEDSGYLPV